MACLRWRAQRRQDVEEGVGVDRGFGGKGDSEQWRPRRGLPNDLTPAPIKSRPWQGVDIAASRDSLNLFGTI
jgi:hypothetical protein